MSGLVDALWRYYSGHVAAEASVTHEAFARGMAEANSAKFEIQDRIARHGETVAHEELVPVATLRGDGTVHFHDGFAEPLWKDVTLYGKRQ